jgi:hypothetical protein
MIRNFANFYLKVHGTWDAQSQFVGPYIAPHTNVTEIDLGLDLLWRAGVTPSKVVLGLGWVSIKETHYGLVTLS